MGRSRCRFSDLGCRCLFRLTVPDLPVHMSILRTDDCRRRRLHAARTVLRWTKSRDHVRRFTGGFRRQGRRRVDKRIDHPLLVPAGRDLSELCPALRLLRDEPGSGPILRIDKKSIDREIAFCTKRQLTRWHCRFRSTSSTLAKTQELARRREVEAAAEAEATRWQVRLRARARGRRRKDNAAIQRRRA
jgi:hypothetical protein